MRSVTACLLVCGCFLLLACAPATGDDTSGDDDETGPPPTGLAISPEMATIDVTDGAAVDTPFTVTATYADGTTQDVTARTTFAVDATYGVMQGGTFRTTGTTAGPTALGASFGGRSVSAALLIRVHQHRVLASAPAGAQGLFPDGLTANPAESLEMVYPPVGVTMPKNLGALDVHWRDSRGHDAFEVTLRSQYGDIHVITGADPSWIAFTPAEWASLSRNDDRLGVELRGGRVGDPSSVGEAPAQMIQLTDGNIEGGLYYWAAGSSVMGAPYGVFRHDVANADQPAEPFYTTTESSGRCVACHAVSRDGKHMTITYDGGDGAATLLDVATRTARPDIDFWNFAVFSPSGDRLLTMYRGNASLRDPDTGAVLETLSVPLGGQNSQYDFSPTGTFLAFVNITGFFGSDFFFNGGAIATVAYDPATHAISNPQVIVPAIGQNNFFPSVSPDGEWVLFNRSDEDGYDDPSASLWTVAAGGGTPIHLDSANTATPNLENSWSRWAPFAAAVGGEPMFWVTFSSKRDFGVRMVGANRPQIWMAPFFPNRAAMGLDPTGPAFWLPFQNLETNNHIAQWTETIVPIE